MERQKTGAAGSEQHPTASEEHIVFGTDIELLHALATAPTLGAVASSVGVSPRHARRLIAKLLDSMGVTNVRSAIAVASARGLIDEPQSAFPAQDQHPSAEGARGQRATAGTSSPESERPAPPLRRGGLTENNDQSVGPI
jgi:hypothetical protein